MKKKTQIFLLLNKYIHTRSLVDETNILIVASLFPSLFLYIFIYIIIYNILPYRTVTKSSLFISFLSNMFRVSRNRYEILVGITFEIVIFAFTLCIFFLPHYGA